MARVGLGGQVLQTNAPLRQPGLQLTLPLHDAAYEVHELIGLAPDERNRLALAPYERARRRRHGPILGDRVTCPDSSDSARPRSSTIIGRTPRAHRRRGPLRGKNLLTALGGR